MENITVKPIDTSIVTRESKEVDNLLSNLGALTIKTQDEFITAGELRSKFKGKIKQLEETRKNITSPLDVAKKAVMDLFRLPIERLTVGVEKIDTATITYTEEQERRAAEEQARLNAKAEKERLAAEAKAKAFADKGNEAKQQEWLDKAETKVAPIVEAATPKVNGQGIRTIWYGEVVDFKVLPDEYKVINQSAIDKVAGALKDKTNIPGVVIKSRKIVSGRSF